MRTENSTDMLKLIAIKNPFDLNSKVIKTVPYEGKTVQKYIEDIYTEVFPDFEVVASVDGRIVDPILTIPSSGSFVVFCLTPADSNNDTLRTVAMLAVMVAAMYTQQHYAWYWAAGVMIAGSLVVNALLPVTPEDVDLDQGSSYGWNAVNKIDEGYTAPVIYGTVKTLPYLIGKYISNEWIPGYNTPDNQRMNLLYFVADHALDSIESIKINGNPYNGYENVSVQTRLGTNDQEVISNFRNTHTQVGINILLTGDWHEVEVPGNENTGIGIGIGCPRGIGYHNNDGNWEQLCPTQIIEYRLQNESDAGWSPLRNGRICGAEPSAIRAHWQIVGLTAGAYKIRFRTTTGPSEGNNTKDQYLDYVEGVVEDDFRYPGNSLLSINAVATDQLSGGLPTVSCVVSRNFVSVWTGSEWENKPASIPAWACYDMLVNDEYGGGVPYSKMIYSDFATWADFCVANSYFCHIVVDVTTSFPEALAKISILGRGHVIQRGTKFGVIIDKADDPVQLFGLGNIIQGTFKQSYLGKNSRANSITVTYFDASKDYERLSFELRTSDFDTASSVDPEKLELTLYGATSKELAAKHAKFLLNCNEYLIRFVEFEVNVDALASNVGNIIYVSHDVPQWGYSGHVVSATTNTIVIDREVTMTPGLTYHILVRHYDDDDLEEVAIVNPETGVAKASLTLSGNWSQIPVVDDIYAFGEITKVAKKFRITNISRSQEMIRRIQALEYRSEVYSDSATIPNYESESALEPFVNRLRVAEAYKRMGGLMVAYASVTWIGFGLHFLYMKEENSARWSLVSTHAGNNWADIWQLEPGKTYYFAVSTTANPSDGQVVSFTFVGWTASRIIWNVSGLQIEGQGNSTVWQNRDLKTVWNLSTDTFPTEADGDPAGASTFPPMTEFGGYRIKITDSDGTLRREIIQIENSYNYSFEKNSEDGGGTPEPNLIQQVWARDKYGQESPIPATITAINPTPSAVSGLSATPWMRGVKFSWLKNTEEDVKVGGHYSYRTKGLVGTINFTGQSGAFTIGNPIYGGTNGGSAIIDSFSVSSLFVSGVVGTFGVEYIYEAAVTSLYSSDFSVDSDDFDQNTTDTDLQVTGNVDAVGGVDDCLKCYANGGNKVFQIRQSTTVTPGILNKITFDYYCEASSGLAYLGMGAGGALPGLGDKENLGNNITITEGSWQTDNILYFVPSTGQVNLRMVSFTTVDEDVHDTLLSGKAIYFKNVVVETVDNYALSTGSLTYDSWSSWIDITNTEVVRNLEGDESDYHGSTVDIYIQVKAVDSFGNESSTQETNATTLGLNAQPTDIGDFAITASKIFTKIPILENDTWTNDTPDGNSVTWNAHTIYYNGVAYSITGGNTDKKYIYWINAASTYSSSDTHPGDGVPLTNEDFIIATNISGEASLAWNAIANQVIGSAYIQELAVLNAHIYSLEAGKIQTGAISSNNWAAAAGFRLDLDNEWLKMGGSNVTAAGSAAGIFNGLDGGLYKSYIGDGSYDYILFDGTKIDISLSSGGLTLKSGADLTLEGDNSNPAELIFDGGTYSSKFTTNSDGGILYLTPSSSENIELQFGLTYPWKTFDVYSKDINIYGYGSATQKSCLSMNQGPSVAAYLGAFNTANYVGRVWVRADGTDMSAELSALYDATHFSYFRVHADSGGGSVQYKLDGATSWDDLIPLSFPSFPIADPVETTEYSTTGDGWVDKVVMRVYIPSSLLTVYGSFYVYRDISGTDCHVRFTINASNSAEHTITSTSYYWSTEVSLDVSALSGWYNVTISIDAQAARITYLKGWAFRGVLS